MSDWLALQYVIYFTFLPIVSGLPAELAAWGKNPKASEIKPVSRKTDVGSNGWALAPGRSPDRNRILMGNPHLAGGLDQPAAGLDVYQWVGANLVIGDPKHPCSRIAATTLNHRGFPGMTKGQSSMSRSVASSTVNQADPKYRAVASAA
jgi:hypothetical protein